MSNDLTNPALIYLQRLDAKLNAVSKDLVDITTRLERAERRLERQGRALMTGDATMRGAD